jgi:hypothetical protein
MLAAAIIVYCSKVSNNNVKLYELPPSVTGCVSPQIYVKCDVCLKYIIITSTEIVDLITAFAEKHKHIELDPNKGWLMGELVFSKSFDTALTPSIDQDTIKRLAKYSNFNVDAQARSVNGNYEYRLVCTKCKEYTIQDISFPQWLARLGFEGEANPVREFCKQHAHGVTVYVEDIVAEVINGRKFRNE